MARSEFAAALAILCLVGCRAVNENPQRGARGISQPNILIILVDDLGWEDVGFQGGPFATPNIDKLASEGLAFGQAYACAPNCAPSRAALLSGMYGPRTGIYTVGEPNRGKAKNRKLDAAPNRRDLSDATQTIAEALGASGYECAAIGKWHLGDDPRTQGFTHAIAGNRRGHPRSYFSPYGNPDLVDGEDGEYLTARLTNEAIEFMGHERDAPFLLYLSLFTVHTPIQPREQDLASTRGRLEDRKSARYAAMVEGLDRDIGRVLGALREQGLERETLVLFTSDNGGHGRFSNQERLRGAKGMLYEGGIRIPFVLSWPGTIEPRVDTTPVIHVDVFPTLLELAGAGTDLEATLDGLSLAPLLTPLLTDGKLQERDLFWHFPAYLEAAGSAPGPWRTTPCGVVRRGPYKLIEYFENGRLELYDLERDLAETHDLGTEQPARRAELHASLRAWRERTHAAMPTSRKPD